MCRLTSSSASRCRCSSIRLLTILSIIIMLLLTTYLCVDNGLKVHAAARSLPKSMHGAAFIYHSADGRRIISYFHTRKKIAKPATPVAREHQKKQYIFLPVAVHVVVLSDNPLRNGYKAHQQRLVPNFIARGLRSLVNPTYQVGQTVNYTLAVSNGSAAGPLVVGDAVTVTDSIPAGLTGLTVSASSSDWTLSLGATTSPTTLTATYVGSYPVAAAATLSTISLTGVLAAAAFPQVINTASVSTPNDSNAANNSASITSAVQRQPDLKLSKSVSP